MARSSFMAAKPSLLVLVLAILLAAGCGAQPSASASPGERAPGSAAPTGGTGDPGPAGTPWPLNVPQAVISMGALHNDLGVAIGELSEAVAAEDTAEIRAVADRLARFLDGNIPNAQKLQQPPLTDIGNGMVEALTGIRDAAAAIRDGADAGDGEAIEAGFRQLADAMDAYAAVQPQIADLMPEAMRQVGADLN